MAKKTIRRRGYVSEVTQFNSYVAQVNAASQGWSGQPPGADTLPDGLLRREYAWRKGDMTSEVVIPFCHSVGYAIIGAGMGVFVARLGGLPLGETVLLLGGTTFAFAFVVTTKNMLKSMWTVEEFGSEEVEEVKAEAAPSTPLRVEIVEGNKTRFLDLPEYITDAKMHSVTTHCLLNGKAFSRRGLKDILTQGEYESLFGVMVKAGLLRETGNGNEITGAGRAVLGKWR